MNVVDLSADTLDRCLGWDAPTEEIRARLVEHRHGTIRKQVIAANVLVALIIVAVLWRTKPYALLLGWFAAVVVTAATLALSMAYYARHRSEHSACTWAFRFSLGAMLNGTVWGMGCLLLFDPATPGANTLMIGVICGMTAANAITSFAIPASAYAYLLPALLLSMIRPLANGGPIDQALAILWIPYFAILVLLTRAAHSGLAQSIRLSFENAHLAENLAAAKERAERLSRAKSEFLAVMSHEIRTPMHGMLGIAELLAASDLDHKQRLYLEHLRGAGEYLSQLLNNILDFSKIDAEKLILQETPFSLAEMVGEVVSLFALQASRKGLQLETVFPDDVPPLLQGDPYRLKQVLVNLLGNAFKFTELGGIRLEVAIAAREADRTRFDFRVFDTGPGIAPELIPTIFDPFTQDPRGGARSYGGTGLGLAISKRLVEAMGGQLALESRIGEGSVFSFAIPLSHAAPDAAATASQIQDEILPCPSLRILHADDAALNRLVVREFLAPTLSTIDEAENGAEALEKFQAAPYDIVLMDMRMPVMDGLESVRCIRRWEAEHNRAPAVIIMLTASAFDSDRVTVMAAGCNALLRKPVQKRALLRLLQSHADRNPRNLPIQPGFTSATPTDV